MRCRETVEKKPSNGAFSDYTNRLCKKRRESAHGSKQVNAAESQKKRRCAPEAPTEAILSLRAIQLRARVHERGLYDHIKLRGRAETGRFLLTHKSRIFPSLPGSESKSRVNSQPTEANRRARSHRNNAVVTEQNKSRNKKIGSP